MIIFENEGDLDPRSITTFGLTSKGSDDKIGRFGTGLKYAIATILRGGGRIQIAANNTIYEFGIHDLDFRGQGHQQVTLNGQPTSFTTSLGRDWKPWMAFRELYSNALDEGGEVLRRESTELDPVEGKTVLAVTWDNFEAIYFSIEEYFIVNEEPIWSNEQLEVYKGSSKFVFYRGIAVMELKTPSCYRYNIKGYVSLTEDRTASYPWMVEKSIAAALKQVTDEEVAKSVTSQANEFEKKFDYLDADDKEPSATFLGAAAANGIECNKSAATLAKAYLPTDQNEVTVISPAQPGGQTLLYSIEILRFLGADLSRANWVLDPDTFLAGTSFAVRGNLIFICKSIFDDQKAMDKAVLFAWDVFEDGAEHSWLIRSIRAKAQEAESERS